MASAAQPTAAAVMGTPATFTEHAVSASTSANTIIGMPAKCVAMLRRSRWYAAYCVRFVSSVSMPVSPRSPRGASLEPLVRLLADLEVVERGRARAQRRSRRLRAVGHCRHDAGVAEEQPQVGGGIRVRERLVGGDAALAHEAEEVLLE